MVSCWTTGSIRKLPMILSTVATCCSETVCKQSGAMLRVYACVPGATGKEAVFELGRAMAR